MALASGTRFGAYDVAEAIGSGGMGEVYRATDSNLKRDVALKVLPASFADDADRLARFQREAEVLASLNHPNIAQIYGLEKADGSTALVMELVEGPTLADRIAQGPIAIDDALGIAGQIAEALEAAHEQGIVHRDLKPANVKLRHDGTVKVLDFGIAKAIETPATTSGPRFPSLTTPALTQAGVVLGTAAYMSPEQARGRPVDRRADIWAFGCVLYEMLTGQSPFGGEDVTITLARVLERDPDMDALPSGVAPAVARAIELCLQKDLKHRARDIGDVRLALSGAFDTAAPRAAHDRPLWRRALPSAVAAIVASVVVGFAVSSLREPPAAEARLVNRFEYYLPQGQSFTAPGWEFMALSPDGRHFVYTTFDGLYLRAMDELEPQLLVPGSEWTDFPRSYPAFSPDGQALVYFADGELRRIPISGGDALLISEIGEPRSVRWVSDHRILYSRSDGIYSVRASGGTPELVIEAGEGERIYGPSLLPDGDSVLFGVTPGETDINASVVVQSLSTGERTVLVERANAPRYLPTGHLLYARDDGLFAAALDVDNLKLTGGELGLQRGMMRGLQTAVAHYNVSDNGMLAYIPVLDPRPRTTIVWVDSAGNEQPLPGFQACFCASISMSPEGDRVAFTEWRDEYSMDSDIFVWSIEQQARTRLTFEPGRKRFPTWMPDGRRIAYSWLGKGVYWSRANGAGAPEPLLESPTEVTPDTAADGLLILSAPVASDSDRGIEMHLLTLSTADKEVDALLDSGINNASSLSPDGQLLSYWDGRDRTLVVRPFPNVEADRIPIGGAIGARWSSDGRTLYYLDRSSGNPALMAVGIEIDPTLRSQPPRPALVFDAEQRALTDAFDAPSFDVAPDGRFLMLRNEDARRPPPQPHIVIVENWFEELERLVPTEQAFD